MSQLLSRPNITINDIQTLLTDDVIDFYRQASTSVSELNEMIEVDIKYSGYIEKEKIIADKINRLDYVKIKDKFDYDVIHSLSTEARQKLKLINPETIGQASLIS